MKLFRNAVFAVKRAKGTEIDTWCTEDDDGHNHWYGVETDGYEIIMVQSHVTHVNQVNMKLCRKLADRTKS